jgi:hypothetical protein
LGEDVEVPEVSISTVLGLVEMGTFFSMILAGRFTEDLEIDRISQL